MMRRLLAPLMFVVSYALANSALAVGLGEARLLSALNQPLLAEIPLKGVAGLDPSQLRVGMASRADFERLAVERTYFLSRIDFAVLRRQDGSAYLRLSTRDAVVEPYLDFVIELRWPQGKILREYTLLLDLPTFSQASATKYSGDTSASNRAITAERRAVAAAPATESFRPVSPRPMPDRTASQTGYSPRTSVSPTALQPVYTARDRYTVKKRDMLWTIAARVLPSSKLTTQQTMIAIAEKNPHAFIDDDVNLLRVGAVLALPNAEEVAAISRSARIEDYSKAGAASASNRAEQYSAVDQSAPERRGSADENRPRLSLSAAAPEDTPVSSEAGQSANAAGDDDGNGNEAAPSDSALPLLQSLDAPSEQQALAAADTESPSAETVEPITGAASSEQVSAAQARADAAEAENLALAERLAALETQLADMQRMLNIKSEQLAGLMASGANDPSDVSVSPKPVSDAYAYWELLLVDLMDSPGPALQRAWSDIKAGNGPFGPSYYYYWLAAALVLLLLLLLLFRRKPKDKAPNTEEVDAELDEALFAKQMELNALDKTAVGAAGLAGVAASRADAPVEDEQLEDEHAADAAQSEPDNSVEAEAIEAPEDLQFDSIGVEAMGVEEILPEQDEPTEQTDAPGDDASPAEDNSFSIDDLIDAPSANEPAAPEAQSESELASEQQDDSTESLEGSDPVADDEAAAFFAELDAQADDVELDAMELDASDIEADGTQADNTEAGDNSIAFSLADTELASPDADEGVGELAEEGAEEVEEIEGEGGLRLASVPEDAGSRDSAQGFADLDSLDGEEDEAGAKLSLARVYIDMGDSDEARSLLEAVLSSGDEAQRSEAQSLLARL